MVDLLFRNQSSAPRPRVAIAGGPSVLFYVTFFAFLVTLGAYTGLIIYNRRLTDTRDNLTIEVERKERNISNDAEGKSAANIFAFDQQLRGLKTLLADHQFVSNTLLFLERNTYPQVRFSNFSFNAAPRRVDMGAETTSYQMLTQQIARLEQSPYVERVEFGGLSRSDKNRVTFKIAITFKSSIVKTKSDKFLKDLDEAEALEARRRAGLSGAPAATSTAATSTPNRR